MSFKSALRCAAIPTPRKLPMPPSSWPAIWGAGLRPISCSSMPECRSWEPSTMKVEVVLTEADIAQEFVEAIEARDLPEKFFFWFPRSAAEWTALASNPELYGGVADIWQQIAADAPTIGRHFGGKVPVISFGAGDGARDRVLMNALKDTGCECLYFPVDASQPMLEAACAGAEDEDFETVGIKADISSPVHLIYAADATEPPRLFVMAGNTMGSFDQLADIRFYAQCYRHSERLIYDDHIFLQHD